MTKIIFTKGDDAALQVRIKRNGEYVDLTGFSFETYFRTELGGIFTVLNTDHTIDPDQFTNIGKLVVNIDAADTATFKSINQGSFIMKVTNAGGKSVHYHGTGLLFILEATP